MNANTTKDRFTAPENEMDHFQIQLKRNRKSQDFLKSSINKSTISNKERDTRHSKSPPTNRQIRKNGVYQMKYRDCPVKYIGHTGRTFKLDKNSTYSQLDIIMVTQNIRMKLNKGHAMGV
jgi:hypothetical protein